MEPLRVAATVLPKAMALSRAMVFKLREDLKLVSEVTVSRLRNLKSDNL